MSHGSQDIQFYTQLLESTWIKFLTLKEKHKIAQTVNFTDIDIKFEVL